MFDRNIMTCELYDDTVFDEVYTFINTNDDEHYGFYKFLYNTFSCRRCIFLHIKKNDVEEILVNTNDKIKDYFGYTDENKRNNVLLIERPYIYLGFDKINIDDNDLIPTNLDNISLYDKKIVVFRNKVTNVPWLVYKTDSYYYSSGYMFFLSRVKEGRTNYIRYTKEQFVSDFNTTLYTPYLLKDDIGVKFTIKLDR